MSQRRLRLGQLLLGGRDPADLALSRALGRLLRQLKALLGLVQRCLGLHEAAVVIGALPIAQLVWVLFTSGGSGAWHHRVIAGVLHGLPVFLGLRIARLRLGQRQRRLLHLGIGLGFGQRKPILGGLQIDLRGRQPGLNLGAVGILGPLPNGIDLRLRLANRRRSRGRVGRARRLGQRILLGLGVGQAGLGLVQLLIKGARVENGQQIAFFNCSALFDITPGDCALGLEDQVGILGGLDLANAADPQRRFRRCGRRRRHGGRDRHGSCLGCGSRGASRWALPRRRPSPIASAPTSRLVAINR